MNENEFEHYGKRYKASECISYCRGCAFADDDRCIVSLVIPPCDKSKQADRKDVIFIEVKCE